MISNEKVVNNKVIELIKIYNVCFGNFSIQLFLTIQNLKFKIWEIQIDCWDSKIFQIKKLSSKKL
jgi:hypothetical protein